MASQTQRQEKFQKRIIELKAKQLASDYERIEEMRAFEMATIILAKEYAHNVAMGNTEGLFELSSKVDLMAKQLAIKQL